MSGVATVACDRPRASLVTAGWRAQGELTGFTPRVVQWPLETTMRGSHAVGESVEASNVSAN